MIIDPDRLAGRNGLPEPGGRQSRRGYSAALACGSGAVAAFPPLVLGYSGILCATVALVVFVAVGLAAILI